MNIFFDRFIVVFFFVNMSIDFENEYFSDGIMEEIINVLIWVEGLKVIVRIFFFVFKGKSMDVCEIGN